MGSMQGQCTHLPATRSADCLSAVQSKQWGPLHVVLLAAVPSSMQ